MHAMQLAAPAPVAERPLALVDLPAPRPGRGEVLLKVRACGVCRTDLHIVEGELPPHRSPVVPGHQIVAEVAGFGVGAERIAPGGEAGARPLGLGERVGVPWLHRTDGTCRFCRSGQENLCEHALFTGWDVDGGFAEYTVAPAAFVYRLPAGMDDLAAAPLLCAGIIGYRCLRLTGIVGAAAGLPDGVDDSTSMVPAASVAGIAASEAEAHGEQPPGELGAEAEALEAELAEAGHDEDAARARDRAGEPLPRRLGLYGFGSAAHLCLQVARWRGWEVYAFTRGAEHRSLALELGAVWAGETSDDPGVLLDAAIIFAPAGELAVDALRRTDRGGIVALGGIYSTPIPPIEYPSIYHERVIRSVANSTRQDARELLRDAQAAGVRSRVQVYDLEQANEALIDLKEDRVRGSAVLRVSGD
jgi:propanol-preferring alcohol dehydrogenase